MLAGDALSPTPTPTPPPQWGGEIRESLRDFDRWGWRAVPPALAENSCGCFLPDLTRFTTMQCGAARRDRYIKGVSMPAKRERRQRGGCARGPRQHRKRLP